MFVFLLFFPLNIHLSGTSLERKVENMFYFSFYKVLSIVSTIAAAVPLLASLDPVSLASGPRCILG